MVTQGSTAPDFTLEADRGAKVTLSELRGRQGEGIRRTTVIVGTDGGIKKVFENVTPQGHAAGVLAAL